MKVVAMIYLMSQVQAQSKILYPAAAGTKGALRVNYGSDAYFTLVSPFLVGSETNRNSLPGADPC